MSKIQPCCLTIAGSDSGGNAGIQADLRTFHDYGVHCCTVITALTAQNPFGVFGIEKIKADFIAAQLNAVIDTYSIAALKTGMLADPASIERISGILGDYPQIAKVIDPVMIATSGAKLIDDDAADSLKKNLLPIASVITPNVPEAEFLSGTEITSHETLREAAKRLFDSYGRAIIIKGGHFEDSPISADTLFDGESFFVFSAERIAQAASTHGTGCSFAAAVAAELALGKALPSAVEGAKNYVRRAIAGSFLVGENCGVLGFAKN